VAERAQAKSSVHSKPSAQQSMQAAQALALPSPAEPAVHRLSKEGRPVLLRFA
jgi:hypothetical protein